MTYLFCLFCSNEALDIKSSAAVNSEALDLQHSGSWVQSSTVRVHLLNC
jgi:hypothetical protein